jgi:hypothetical protein
VPKYRVAPLFVALLASCAGHLPPTTGEPDFGGQWLLTLKAANSELQIASGHLELRRTAQREHFLGPAEPCERCWEGPFQVSLPCSRTSLPSHGVAFLRVRGDSVFLELGGNQRYDHNGWWYANLAARRSGLEGPCWQSSWAHSRIGVLILRRRPTSRPSAT